MSVLTVRRPKSDTALGSLVQEIWHRYPIQNALRRLQQFCERMVFVRRDSHAKLHPKSASVRHDALAERLPQGIVGRERAVDVVVIGERLSEGLRLCAGLGDTKSDVGSRLRRRPRRHGRTSNLASRNRRPE